MPGGKTRSSETVESLAIDRAISRRALYLRVELPHLHVQYRGLKIVEARVESPRDNEPGVVAAVVAKKRHLSRHVRIVREKNASIAETAKDFAG